VEGVHTQDSSITFPEILPDLYAGRLPAGVSILSREAGDVQDELPLQELIGSLAIQRLVIAPLEYGGNQIGSLCAGLEDARPIDDLALTYLRAIAGQTTLMVLNLRLQQDTQRRLKRLMAMRTIEVAITGSLDLKTSTEIILEQGMAQLEVDAASVSLLNPANTRLEYFTGKGFRTSLIQQTNLRLGDELPGRAAIERKTLGGSAVVSYLNSPTRKELIAAEKFQTCFATPMMAKGQLKGVLEVFHRESLPPDGEWIAFLEILARQIATAVEDATMYAELQRAQVGHVLTYGQTLEAWAEVMDRRNGDPEGHSQRVADATVRLAQLMGVSDAELLSIRWGALLHDIGMVKVPEAILSKKESLTPEEWDTIRQHPKLAYEMLSPIVRLKPALDIPYCHHERWDGSGYPRGLKGKEIPIAARLFSVVETWDLLRNERPYRPAMTETRARAYMLEQSGKQFDPRAVERFLESAELRDYFQPG
jgi:response regulator RpfG family c-di-GMP phosphodiesterase